MNRLTKTAFTLFMGLLSLTLAGCDSVLEFGVGLGIFGIILAILLFILVIWAVVDIIQKPYPIGKKLIWIIVILFIPYIGAILYFLIGRKDSVTTTHHDRL